MGADGFYLLGMLLILVGAILLAIALILLITFLVKDEKKFKGGGAIFIGPIPIIFGTDKDSIKAVLWLAIAVTILLIILTVIMNMP